MRTLRVSQEPSVAPLEVRVNEFNINCNFDKTPNLRNVNSACMHETYKMRGDTPKQKTPRGPLEYRGSAGRPSDSLEQIFVKTPLEYSPRGSDEVNSAQAAGALTIQNCLRFWSVPRWRARGYDPRRPPSTQKPGATRLPGYELSTREAAALHYLIENGRIGELDRSLSQLLERGAQLTEKSLLPMSVLSRQLGELSASRAILEFAEQFDLPRSGRLYSETILTVLNRASREDAEAIAWRAARKGYLLSPTARSRLEEAGSYTSEQWRAHWRLQVLRVEEAAKRRLSRTEAGERCHVRAPFAVFTRHRGCTVEVLTWKGQVAPFHSFSGAAQTAPRRPADAKSTFLPPGFTYPNAVDADPLLCQALADAVEQHSEGHAYCQWKSLVMPLREGRCPYPQEGMRKLTPSTSRIREGRAAFLAPESSFEASTWHVELRPGDKPFCKPPEEFEWIPLDEAVWALGEADPLQLWRHLLIQTTRCPGAVAAGRHPRIERSPTGLPRALVACEESLTVNSRLSATHHAIVMSVDLLPPEYDGPRHLVNEVTEVLHLGWDLLIGFPPCQHLCNSSSMYLPRPGRRERMKTAADFFGSLWTAHVPAVALENPRMHSEACEAIGGVKPSQTIHPHMHACEVTKPTNLYLRGLPVLQPSQVVAGRMHSISALPPGPLRAMIKGRTFDGIARAMAQQWVPAIAAARLQMSEDRIALAVRHSLNRRYGIEGALSGPRPDWNAVRHFQREATVIAAIMKASSRSRPTPPGKKRERTAADPSSPTQEAAAPERSLKEITFAAWKRSVELARGGIFGVSLFQRSPLARQFSGRGAKSRWLAAQRIISQHLLECADPTPAGRPVPNLLPPPVPPIRRIHRRFGSWWLWMPIAGTKDRPPRHEWRKLSPECQAVLGRAAAGLRSEAARFGQGQMPPLIVKKWARLARSLRMRCSLATFREANEPVASLLPSVARVLGDVCPKCKRPRSGADPCPRGLGAESCEPPARATKAIQFVKAGPAPCVGAVTGRLKAEGVISQHARSWRLRRQRRDSALGRAWPLDKHMCAAHGMGSLPSPCYRVGAAPRPPKVRLNEKAEPELVKLRLPVAFGEDTVSDTPTLPPHHRTHCAWLKDVLICTHNVGQKRLKAPYLVGRACAWSPAAMGDSGAAISLVGTELLKLLPPDAVVKFRWARSQISKNVCGPNGEPLVILGEVELLLTISRVPFRHKFWIVLGGDLLLLGADFMAPREGDVCPRVDKGDGISGFCTLNHPTYGRVRLPLTTDPVQTQGKPSRVAAVAPATPFAATLPQHHLLFNVAAFRVAPRSERELLLRLPDRLQDPPCTEPLLVKPLADHRGLDPTVRVAYSLSRPRKPEGSNDLHVPVRVLNLAQTAVSVPALSPLAEMEIGSEAADPAEGLSFSQEEIQKILGELDIDPDGVLSAEQRQQVDELIKRRLGAFAQDANAPSQTHAIEVHLPLKEGAVPHRHAPPRLGVEGRRFVRENVAEMERRGIVYKTQSPWASRIVLVRKKDGSLRQCIDYRDLNAKLLVQDSPLPRIDTCLEAMTEGFFNEQIAQLKKEAESPLQGAQEESSTATAGQAEAAVAPTQQDMADTPVNSAKSYRGAPRFWCSVDLASGFHGIPIAPESQPQTAFVTPDGKYAYTRLPFGLQCAPSYMVNLMNEVMQGLQWSICVCYMDDTLVWAQSFEEMMERLELVLERFIGANLSLKAKKCVLFATKVDFLGFRLSNQGIEVSPEKVEAIKKINSEAINNLTAVRSFLGAASFYRKHIRGFASIAKPLTELTRQGVDVSVESQKEPAQTAIRTLKEALTTTPVLALPRWDLPFIVHTDACITGLGAVLCQRDEEGTERPIAYWGRVLTPAETNYTVSELELLAIVSCIKHWRPYLWSASGKKFILRVDHAALLYLHTAKDTVGGGPASRLQRWYLKLQEYRFEVWHRPGRIHYDADFISRMQGNPEYARLTRDVDTPDWARVSEESVRRHTAAHEQGSVSQDPEVQANPPNAGNATTGGAALKEGGRVPQDREESPSKKSEAKAETLPPTNPPTDAETREIIALVNTTRAPAGGRVSQAPATSEDLSVQETFDLLAALEARLPADERPAALEKLGVQLRKGRGICMATLEAILGRLREQGLGLRAAELAEVMMSAHRISKKALYIALAATHKAGLCLQSAPLQRALSTDFNVRSTGMKKMLQALELEFDGGTVAAEELPGSRRRIPYVHIIVTASDGQLVWCPKPTSQRDDILMMSASKECSDETGIILTARRALRETLVETPPTLVSTLDDQLKLFPQGQARVNLPGNSDWHKESRHFFWLVPLHPPDPYELRSSAEKPEEEVGWFSLAQALQTWKPAVANAVAKARRRYRDTSLPELHAQHQITRGMAGENLPEVQSLRRSLNSLVATCVTWHDWEQLSQGRWAAAKVIGGIDSPAARTIAATNTRRSKAQPLLAPVTDSVERAKQVWSKYAAHEVPHSEDIRREQQADLWCSEIMEHLISEAIPPKLTGPAVARFVATAAEYTIREGLLFRYQRDPRAHRNAVQLAVPVTLRVPFMEAFHERAGHPGVERTYQALRQRAYWPGMRESVVQHVAECHECALAKKPCHSFGTTILPGVPSRPFDTIYADVLTLPESEPVGPNELIYSKLLIFCDALTRWVEAIPLPSEPTSEEIVEAFIENIVSRFGVPRCLVCDRGSNLISKLCQEVYELLGVDMKPSTAYHHNTSGLVERYNRTLAGLLRAAGKDGKDWPLHVPWLNFLFRATPHEVTKESPAFLALGRELRTPADLRLLAETDPEVTAHTATQPSSLSTPDADTEADTSASPYTAQALKRRLEIAWDSAAHLSKAAQMSSKERRDLSRREPEYQVGDRVLVRRPVNDHTGVPEGGKLAPIYEGPYRVSEVLENGNVQLRDLKSRGLYDVFHVTRLRPYLTYTSEKPLEEDEYLVEKILARRGEGENREYLIKWKGWSSAFNGWEPQAHLMRHCMDEVAAFDANCDDTAARSRRARRQPAQPDPGGLTKLPEQLLKEIQEREERRANRTRRVAAPVRPRLAPAGSNDEARLLNLAVNPRPATEARLISGAWHYFCPTDGNEAWIDQRFFCPAELEAMSHLRSKQRPAQTCQRNRQGREARVATTSRRIGSPHDPGGSSKEPTKVGGVRSSSPATSWAALSLPHCPDLALLRKSQKERDLSESTAKALVVAERAAQMPLAARVEDLKDRLSQPNPSWLDYSHWTKAMGKLYDDQRGEVVSRQVRSKVPLQWRAERLDNPIPGPWPKRGARELQEIMEKEAAKRSSLLGDPETEPHVRTQLLEQEELLAQAYHYLATRQK